MAEKKSKKGPGRPSKYDPKYCAELVEFFNRPPYETIERRSGRQYVARDLPFIQEFCRKIGVSKDTLHQWVKAHPEFDEAYKEAKDSQEIILVVNGLRGLYNPTFAIFTAKNILGWRDTKDISMGGKVGLNVIMDLSADSELNGSK